MSKKKHKKNKSYYDYYYGDKKGGKKKDKEKSGKKDKSYYKAPKMKMVKPTLDKKEAKESKKILMAPIDIPKAFVKNRNKCNHADGLISVAEFKNMTPTYGAFTPMLDAAIEVFGEENLHICKYCYDVVVNPECLSEDRVKESLVILYMAANAVVSRKRMKPDEVKDIAKTKNDLSDWNNIIDLFEKLVDDGAMVSYHEGDNERAVSSEDLNKLNKAGGTFTI